MPAALHMVAPARALPRCPIDLFHKCEETASPVRCFVCKSCRSAVGHDNWTLVAPPTRGGACRLLAADAERTKEPAVEDVPFACFAAGGSTASAVTCRPFCVV